MFFCDHNATLKTKQGHNNIMFKIQFLAWAIQNAESQKHKCEVKIKYSKSCQNLELTCLTVY